MILSASRRCDLPAFGFEYFLRSLDEGFVEVRNPFNAASVRRVSLAPADLDCIVFWTRDPRRLLAGLDRLRELRDRFFAHVTVTGYPRELEPGVAATDWAIGAVRDLASRIGKERIVWRYDPVVLAGSLDRAFHLANFTRLADRLAGSVSRVVVSLLDEYTPTRGRLERAGFGPVRFGSRRDDRTAAHGPRRETAGTDGLAGLAAKSAPPPIPAEPWPGLLAGLGSVAAAFGLPIGACAEPFDLAPFGIDSAPCIDGSELGRLFGFAAPTARDSGQRPACRCSPSVDIGAYGPCPAGCVYCYARR